MNEDLVARLLAAIDDTARIAREATAESGDSHWSSESRHLGDGLGGVRRHIAHNDPQAVLRHCAAEREIIDEYRACVAERDDYADNVDYEPSVNAEHESEVRALGRAIRILARAYDITTEAPDADYLSNTALRADFEAEFGMTVEDYVAPFKAAADAWYAPDAAEPALTYAAVLDAVHRITAVSHRSLDALRFTRDQWEPLLASLPTEDASEEEVDKVRRDPTGCYLLGLPIQLVQTIEESTPWHALHPAAEPFAFVLNGTQDTPDTRPDKTRPETT